MNEADIIESNYDYLCTETTIKKNVSADEVAALMRSKKRTAGMRIEFISGGIRVTRISERTRIPESKRDQIRKILGME